MCYSQCYCRLMVQSTSMQKWVDFYVHAHNNLPRLIVAVDSGILDPKKKKKVKNLILFYFGQSLIFFLFSGNCKKKSKSTKIILQFLISDKNKINSIASKTSFNQQLVWIKKIQSKQLVWIKTTSLDWNNRFYSKQPVWINVEFY